jgi:tetrahydrodipicolinate N-succinyltransferase
MPMQKGSPNIPILIEDSVITGINAIMLNEGKMDKGAILPAGAAITSPIQFGVGILRKKFGTRSTRDNLIEQLRLIGSKLRIEDLGRDFST